MKKYIAGAILALAISIPFYTNAQDATQGMLNVWRRVSGYLTPSRNTDGVKVPSLASTNDCLITDSSGVFFTSDCGAGGGGSTTINSLLGPDFTIAAGSNITVATSAPNTITISSTASGSGATTTIFSNATSSGPNLIVATGTMTGLNLNITGSDSTVTFSPSLQSGYVIPLTASTTNWQTAYTWGDHAGLYPTFSYSSTTFPSFTYASSTYAVGGSNTHVQYNDNGVFGGNSSFVYNGSNQITLGDDTTGGNFTLTTRDQTTADTAGKSFVFTVGAGNGTGDGGGFSVTTGLGDATGNGGPLSFTTSRGGASGGNGGNIGFTAGNSIAGNGNGGNITFKAGAKHGAGTAGTFRIQDATSLFLAVMDVSGLSNDRTFTFPDATGTLCLTSSCATYSYASSSYATLWNLRAGTNVQISTSSGVTISSTDQYTGTVTSVDMTVPTGLSVSGNPITTSGTLAVSLTAGYVIPLSASTTEWSNLNTNVLSRLRIATGTAGTNFHVSTSTNSITINCPDASASNRGCLTAANWTTFNNKLSAAITSLAGQTGATQTLSTSTSGGLDLKVASASNNHQFILGLNSGYQIPTSTDFVNWNTAFGWGNHASGGYALAANVPTYTYASGAYATLWNLKAGSNIQISTTSGVSISSTDQYTGTVTSVDMSVPTGLSVSGNPITTAGTLALSLQSGYVIPLTASTTEWASTRNTVTASSTAWDTAYTWGNHASAGYALSSNVPTYTYASSAYATVWGLKAGSNITITTSTPGQVTIAAAGGSGLTSLAGQTGNTQTFSTTTSGGLDLKVVSAADDHQFQISLQAGYTIPLSASTTEWSGLYNNVLSRLRIATGTAGTNFHVATTTNSITINCPDASASNRGCLSSTDWSTFNGKLSSAITSINAATGPAIAIATGTTGTDFNLASSSNTFTFNLPTASASNRGALSATDWSTFNNKLTSVSALTGPALHIATSSDTNILISVSTTTANTLRFIPSFTGTLAAARLNSNVVQAITNDTNVTGSITTQNLTLGWTGQLAVSRGGTGASSFTPGFVVRGVGTSALASGVIRDNGIVAGINATSASISLLVRTGSGLDPFVVSSTTSANYFTVKANGLVGVGSTTPIATFVVQGTTTLPTTDILRVATSTGVSYLTVKSSGYVGINSSTPSALFTVDSQTTNATTTIQLDAIGTKGVCLKIKDSDGSGYTYVSYNNGTQLIGTGSCE